MLAMCGWLSEARTCASRVNRAQRSGSAANSGGRIFSATSRRSFVSRARYTSPIPPAPSRPTTSYAPSRPPGVIDTERRDYSAASFRAPRERWRLSSRSEDLAPVRHQSDSIADVRLRTFDDQQPFAVQRNVVRPPRGVDEVSFERQLRRAPLDVTAGPDV